MLQNVRGYARNQNLLTSQAEITEESLEYMGRLREKYKGTFEIMDSNAGMDKTGPGNRELDTPPRWQLRVWKEQAENVILALGPLVSEEEYCEVVERHRENDFHSLL